MVLEIIISAIIVLKEDLIALILEAEIKKFNKGLKK